MAKAIKRDLLYLTQRHQTWHFVRDVPRPLRAAMGKKTIVWSLQTHDLRVARDRRTQALHRFQEEIRAVKHNSTTGPRTPLDDALEWRLADAEARLADPEYDPEDINSELVEMRAEAIEAKHGKDVAKAFGAIALGQSEPISLHVNQWLKESAYSPRSNIMHRQAIRELGDWCAVSKIPLIVTAIDDRVAGRFVSHSIATHQSINTAKKKMSSLRSYWGWMKDRGIVAKSPWEGRKIGTPRGGSEDPDEQIRPYTDHEVMRLVSGETTADIRDFMLIGALSGMRIGEIARLAVGDCTGAVFTIRKSKTTAGQRLVPIHSALGDLIASRTTGKAQEAWLFPALKARMTGERSMSTGAAFGRYRQSLGIHDVTPNKRGSRLNFHSFRKWFVTRADPDGTKLSLVQQIVGHKPQHVTMKTYHGGFDIEVLRAVVESVRLPAGVPEESPERTSKSPA